MNSRDTADVAFAFEDEVFFSLRKQRNFWAIVAVVSLLVAVAAVGAVIAIIPLKEVRPYLVMVDRSNGQAQRIVQVEPLLLTEQVAVREAELVRYVSDRETYDISDNQQRIPDVLVRSEEQAANSLRSLWNSNSAEYPPTIYKSSIMVKVTVLSISQLDDNTAQVRFRKALKQEGQNDVERDFVATVSFAFRPKTERNLDTVWKNPLGFVVTNYRIDAETLSPRRS